MSDQPRLIERAFPLKQASLDSVHEKNVRHGHISTLHIWPARRPLAACRAALIATLMPDPGTPEARQKLCEMIGGRVVKTIEKKKMPNGSKVEREKLVTEGGILHWGREIENASTLEWFRQEIRKAYGGRAPKVLDPFAGGGAIPLEAMRLGCEVTAVDVNPVAWFILRCTLEYPQKLAGQVRTLPEFIFRDEQFMTEFFVKAKGMTKGQAAKSIERLGRSWRTGEQTSLDFAPVAGELDADFSWHVRAWGRRVLARARRDLAKYYPTYADFEPLDDGRKPYERHPMQLVPLLETGEADVDSLNRGLSSDYLVCKSNPRWIAKPTVAYFWARTMSCKHCRATVPLLKTRWLCKRVNKRVLLVIEPNARKDGIVFGVFPGVPASGGNAAQRREHDKRLGAGTMSRAGAACPCCGTINTMQDLRLDGRAGRLGSIMTAVVVDTPNGKAYRPPTDHELAVATLSEEHIEAAFRDVPFGAPDEPTPAGGGSGAGRAFSVQGYGLMKWRDLFSPRQLMAMGTFVAATRATRDEMAAQRHPPEWIEAVGAYMACGFDRMLDFNAATLSWITSVEAIGHTFARFALPMTWDYCEAAPINGVRGGWDMCLGAVMESQPTLCEAGRAASMSSKAVKQSGAQALGVECYDAVVTDPPYYDAIPYSDLMDYFYIWQRRVLNGLSPDIDAAQAERLSPKWDHDLSDGELIDDASRHGNDAIKSKQAYEDGMACVFARCAAALKPEGRLVIVFANKQPDAWETLVSGLIRAGFVVDGSWPILTEQAARMRAQSSAALASSVWLVGKKRSAAARPGWDNQVLEEMRTNIAVKLREFWDAGIRGPDFVWAATGPALEAYSKHPVVKRASSPGTMTVTEFLAHVRRLVVDYIVGQVLSGTRQDGGGASVAESLDEPTAYYLLHRYDFGLEDAPVGAVILYAVSCGLSDRELADTWDLISHGGDDAEENDVDRGVEDEQADGDEESSGSTVRLKPWSHRKRKSLGEEAPNAHVIPLIDRVHRLMQLWKAGDLQRVDQYLDEHGLRRQDLFKRVVQALIELARNDRRTDREELQILESLSNHIGARGAQTPRVVALPFEVEP